MFESDNRGAVRLQIYMSLADTISNITRSHIVIICRKTISNSTNFFFYQYWMWEWKRKWFSLFEADGKKLLLFLFAESAPSRIRETAKRAFINIIISIWKKIWTTVRYSSRLGYFTDLNFGKTILNESSIKFSNLITARYYNIT